jgi:hypothetical protein
LDEEIVRAKRAYNELYHADRLAHMSATARAIAEEKVKAANEAAQALLAPALRSRRDAWVASAARAADPGEAQPPPDREWSPAAAAEPSGPTSRPAPARGATRLPRRFLGGLVLAFAAAVGAMVVVFAFDAEPRGGGQDPVPAVPESSPARADDPAPAASRPPAAGRALGPVIDSVARLQADGRWSAPVTVGGAKFGAAVFPEGPGANFRVRVDRRDVQARFDQPAIHSNGSATTWEFATLTGTAARLWFSRWPADAPSGTVIHSTRVTAGAGGEWSARVWPPRFRLTWEPDRSVAYEARDNLGRTYRLLPTIRSIVAEPAPEWLEFRVLDSLRLTLAVRYAVP